MLSIWLLLALSGWCASATAVDAQPYPSASVRSERFKVAIVGSGVAGATTAYSLANASNVELHVFEKSDQLGGRTCEATLEDGRVVELGGSIGIAANKHLVHFIAVLGLKRVEPSMDASTIGIWDGQQFRFAMDGSLWSKLRALARCVPATPT